VEAFRSIVETKLEVVWRDARHRSASYRHANPTFRDRIYPTTVLRVGGRLVVQARLDFIGRNGPVVDLTQMLSEDGEGYTSADTVIYISRWNILPPVCCDHFDSSGTVSAVWND
jgi:hypothetical protein